MFIFRDISEFRYFLKKLKEYAGQLEVEVNAFCIMGNHYHLLITTKEPNISDFMHNIQSAYANHLVDQGWSGHVYERRFEAKLVTEERHLQILAMYIHLNPIRAGIVTNPEEYPWSSYRAFVGQEVEASYPWISTGLLLEQFASDPADARKLFKEFVLAGAKEDMEGFRRERAIARGVFGSGQSVDDVRRILMPGSDDGFMDEPEKRLVQKVRGLFIAQETVLTSFKLKSLSINDLVMENEKRKIMAARKAFIFLARKYTIATNAEIARVLGGIGETAVSQAYSRLIRPLDSDPAEPAFMQSAKGGGAQSLRELDERMKRRMGETFTWGLAPCEGGE